MYKIFIALSVSALLSGCAPSSERAKQQDEINKTIPICKSDKQCEAAWSGARQWVNQNCGMKIQTYSNDYIETYNSIGSSPKTACQVNKLLSPDGLIGIQIMISCANMFGCVPDQYESVIKFNKDINEYIEKFSPAMIGVLWGMADRNGNLAKSAAESSGLFIKSISSGGLAEKNGLQVKDIVTRIGSKRIIKLSDYGNVMGQYAAGDKVDFTILRNGKEVNIPFTL
ncbi:PDZ domain-containing protein [Photorhabdus khanii]|uniref:PDZ domain-containing protein n=1 Tax=Photorhabdus khanii subsp. guanajuatensis TaxID=2100166 RepID=A0A4R4JRP6_9GAMM|nr:PDZ domain-containing protein [Photorhabdus khanii]TDB57250.1 hypothetical protein C5467_11420 [Photorhabdus khanii subsp. guanajuatensis]